MPTYQYSCENCKYEFEELQSFSDKPLKKCPKCKKNKLIRLFGCGLPPIFLGGGWAREGYSSSTIKEKDKDIADGIKINKRINDLKK